MKMNYAHCAMLVASMVFHSMAATGYYWTGDALDGLWETSNNWVTQTISGNNNWHYLGTQTNNQYDIEGNIGFERIMFTEGAAESYTLKTGKSGSRLFNMIVEPSLNGALMHTFWLTADEVKPQKGTRFTVLSPATGLRFYATGGKVSWIGKEYTYKDGAGTFVYDHAGGTMNVSQLFLSDGVVDCQANFNGFFSVESGSPGGTFTNSSDTRQCLLTLGAPNGALTGGFVDGMAVFPGNVSGNIRLVVGSTGGALTAQIFSGSLSITNTTTVYSGRLYINATNVLFGNISVIGATSADVDAVVGGNASIAMTQDAVFTLAHTGTRTSRAILAPGVSDSANTESLAVGTTGHNNSVNFGKQGVLRINLTPQGASSLVVNGDLVIQSDAEIEFIMEEPERIRFQMAPVVSWTGSYNGVPFTTVTNLPEQYSLRYYDDSITVVRNDLGTMLILR